MNTKMLYIYIQILLKQHFKGKGNEALSKSKGPT